jgi:YD repeat-containing protein
MSSKIKTIRRFMQLYKNFSFSELMTRADAEFIDMQIDMDEAGNVLSESKFSEEGELEEKNSYTYNSQGKLTGHVLLFAVEDVTERRELRRDDKGRLLEEIKFYGDDTGERTEYQYDDKDNVSSIVYYDEEGNFSSREEMRYNDDASLTERIRYDGENNVTERLSIGVASEEKQVEEIEFNPDGSVKSKALVKFNEAGKEVSSVQRTPEGKLISSVESTYDEKGNVVERRYKDFYSKTLRYAYDEKDRLITQELYDGSGMLLRKNIYEYDEEGNVTAEQTFEIDTSRGGRDKHFGTRYEYEFFS